MGAHKALAPSLNTMIPKLYRYQFDSDPKIQSTMRTLWRSLVDNPTETINVNFHPIMVELIKALSAKAFRVRLCTDMPCFTL
jgi:proteasome component ECM29